MLKVLLDATKPQEGSNGTNENNHYSDSNDNNQASIFFDYIIIIFFKIFYHFELNFIG